MTPHICMRPCGLIILFCILTKSIYILFERYISIPVRESPRSFQKETGARAIHQSTRRVVHCLREGIVHEPVVRPVDHLTPLGISRDRFYN